MAFMIPQYDNGQFETYENEQGESTTIPTGTLSASELDELGLSLTDHTLGKWYCRLSAPGYMDCTEWAGPFDTIEDARGYIMDQYDVDPDTGDDLDYNEGSECGHAH